MLLHLSDNILKFRLISRFSPVEERAGPVRIDGQIHKWNRSRSAPCVSKSGAIEDRAKQAVELVPIGNVQLLSGARKFGSEPGINISRMTVTEDVINAAVFIEDSIILLDQLEELFFIGRAGAGKRFGKLLTHPAVSVGIRIHIDDIFCRNLREQYRDGERHSLAACPILENRAAMVGSRLYRRGDP